MDYYIIMAVFILLICLFNLACTVNYFTRFEGNITITKNIMRSTVDKQSDDINSQKVEGYEVSEEIEKFDLDELLENEIQQLTHAMIQLKIDSQVLLNSRRFINGC